MGTLISHFSSHLIQLAINQEILAILWRGGGGGGGVWQYGDGIDIPHVMG